MAISTVLTHDPMPAVAGATSWFEGVTRTSAAGGRAPINGQQTRCY